MLESILVDIPKRHSNNLVFLEEFDICLKLTSEQSKFYDDKSGYLFPILLYDKAAAYQLQEGNSTAYF